MNLYGFVRNNPLTRVDPLGDWETGDPAPKDKNTIVCDGNGGIKIQIGNCGTEKECGCLKSCIEKHEEKHKEDVLKGNPKVCEGKSEGLMVVYSNETEQKATEINASDAEIACLKEISAKVLNGEDEEVI